MVRRIACHRGACRRQDRAHRHRLSPHQGALHDRQRQSRRPSRSSSRCATDRSATCTANGASMRSPTTRARSNSSSPTSSPRTCSKLSWVRSSATSRTRSSTRSSAAPRRCIRRPHDAPRPTRLPHAHRHVAYAAPGVEALVMRDAARRRHGRRRRRRSRASSRIWRSTRRGSIRAVFGQRAKGATPLADGDRVELTRPLDRRSEARPAPARRDQVRPGTKPSTGRRNVRFARDRTGASKMVQNPPVLPQTPKSGTMARCLPSTHAATGVALAAALTARLCAARTHAAAQSAPPQNALARTAKEAATVAWNGAQDVAIYALGSIGVDYRYGGETPESGRRLQRAGALCLPAGHRGHAAADVEGVEPAGQHGRQRRPGPGRSRVLQHPPPAVLACGHLPGRQPFHPCAVHRQRSRDLATVRNLLAEALQRRAPVGRRDARRWYLRRSPHRFPPR